MNINSLQLKMNKIEKEMENKMKNMEKKPKQENTKQENILPVIMSPLEETLTKIPFIGEIYRGFLKKEYQKYLPEYKIILK